MKKLFLLLLLATPASADITQTLQSVVSVKVDQAYSDTQRIGSSITISGNNVTPASGGTDDALGTLDMSSITAGVPDLEGDTTFSVTNNGDSFSVTETYIEADAIPTVLSTTVTDGVVSSLPILGDTTTYSGGDVGSLDASLDSGQTMSITAGNAGTTGTMQSSITIEID
tara:strand:+ start:646 stop:1155 length:510 start_codon:yes stop_codon:yes gene_type:complete